MNARFQSVAGLLMAATLFAIGAWFSTSTSAQDTEPCENGTAVTSPADNAELVADCEVLLALKDELRGTAALNWSADLVITSWDGVTVNRGFVLVGAPLRVAKLVLRDESLNGSLPSRLGRLTGLYEVDLRGNQLTGPIPSEWGNLTKMLYLYLQDNELSGPIPRELGQLANLRQLALTDNQLSGLIPPELGGLSQLRSLNLDDNQLSGRIPSQLGGLTRLTTISLDGNQLTGCLPPRLRSVASNDFIELGLADCPATATLTLTAGANGSTTPAAGTNSYAYGTSVTVTATPDTDYKIASWTGACADAGTAATCTLVLDLNLTAGVSFERDRQTLTTWSGANGSISPAAGEHQYDHGTSVTVIATPDTGYRVEAWGGDCIDSGASTTCTLTMDGAQTARVVFAPTGTVCATATDRSCLIAVYRGAHDEYASIADIPAERRISPNTAGQYVVGRGEQVTVMTRAAVPNGYTRLYLQRSPQEQPYPAVAERLIPPAGTTYTFTVSTDESAARLITYDLTAARPRPLPRPGRKPELGDVIVTTVFKVKPPPLTLELTSSREVCTANTLTELSWTISGGEPPYALTIEGVTVDATAESHRVDCGAIPTDPLTGDPIPSPIRTFSATVADSQTTRASARDEVQVDLAPALPPPTELNHASYPNFVTTSWSEVPNVGQLEYTNSLGYADRIPIYAVRYRAARLSEWKHIIARRPDGIGIWETPAQGVHVMSVAALRDQIEVLTPGALQWSESHRYATVQLPQNLVVTATHNVVTVSWDKQPYGGHGFVLLRSDAGLSIQRFSRATVSGRETIEFGHLPSSTQLDVTVKYEVVGYSGGSSARTVTTLAPPSDYTPQPSGPRNVRTNVTHDTVTVTWDEAVAGLGADYLVQAIRVNDGTLVHTEWLEDGETAATVTGNEFAFLTGGRFRLWPDTQYKITIRQLGIGPKDAVITVRTLPSGEGANGRSATGGAVDPLDLSVLYPFLPHWPLRLDTVFALTDDPFDWRGDHFHAGLDIGAEDDSTARDLLIGQPRGQVRAVAPGTLRIFNDKFTGDDPEPRPIVLYCPDDRLPFHEQFHTYVGGSAYWDGSSLSDVKSDDTVFCKYLVTAYSGRTALIFHDLGAAGRFVTKYAHLAKRSIPSDLLRTSNPNEGLDRDGDGFADSAASIDVTRDTVIGALGRSGVAEHTTDYQVANTGCASGRCEEAFVDPHIHFEIRRFSGKASDDWYLSASHCANGKSSGEYCEWSALRSLKTVVDPEMILRPLPASYVPRDVGKRQDVVTASAGARAVELVAYRETDPADDSTISVTLSYAFWRPAMYSRFHRTKDPTFDLLRQREHGVSSTRPGVDRYFSEAECAATEEIQATGSFAADEPRTGEFPRQLRTVQIEPGDECEVGVRSSNFVFENLWPGRSVPRSDIAMTDPRGTIRMIGRLDGGSTLYSEPQKLADESIDLYSFRALPGKSYSFCTTKGHASTTCVDEASGNNVAEILLVGPAADGQSGIVTTGLTKGTNGLSWTVPTTPMSVETLAVAVRRRARFEGGAVADYRYRLKYTVPDVPVCDPSDLNDHLVLYCDPPAPVISGTSNISATGFTVNFSSSHRATSYQAMLTVDGVSKVVEVESTDLEANSQSHPFTDLMPNKLHQVQVRALNATGPSAWSTSYPVRTLELPFCIGPLGGAARSQRDDAQSQECKVLDPPITEEPSEITTRSAKLSWTAKGDDLLFELHKVKGNDCNTELPRNLSDLDRTSERFFVFRELTANTAYRLCVRATLTVGEGDDAVTVRSAWAWEPATTLNRPARPPDKQRNLETATDKSEWRVPRDNSTACEWAEFTVQPQRNRAVWSTERQAWVFEDDGWVDDGEPTMTWERTTKACVPNPGPLSRDLETATGMTEWRAPKDNSTACEWAEYTVQAQTNPGTWSSDQEAWQFPVSGWEDDGKATTIWKRTEKACVPNPGPLSRDLETATGMTEWRVPKDNSTACEWAKHTVQPQTNPGTWSSAAEAWQFPESGWVDDGEATTTWKQTKKECVSNPGPRNRNLENPTGMTEWRVPANIACEWAEYTVQPQTNPGTWSSAAEAWQFPESGWVDDGGASTTWKRTTRACKTKPADDVIHVAQYQSQSQTRWVAIDDGIFCLEEEEKRYRYKGAYFLRPHVWSDSEEAWVDGTQNASPFFVDPVFGDWTGWSRTGNSRPCAASSDERAESGQASGAIKPARLTTGDYRLQWGEHWLRFTVPEGTFVTLRGRTLDSGVHAGVFQVAGGAELVVDPAQLSVTEPPPTTLTRGVSDPTLTAFAASLRLSPEQPAEELPHREQECRELIGNSSTAAPIDLGVSGCAVARGGGRFLVSLAEAQLTVSLPSGRDWLLAVSGTADSTPALALVEMESGGYVMLSIVTGAELDRQIPATSTGLDAVLDAISASPVTSDGG